MTKKIISVLMAAALLLTSINYAPKDVEAADYSTLTFTEVTIGTYTYGYNVMSNTIAGANSPEFLDNGITMQVAFAATTNVAVTINDVAVEAGVGAVTHIGAAIVKLNPSLFNDNDYTKIVITTDTGEATIIVKRGTPKAEETTEVPTEQVTDEPVIIVPTAPTEIFVNNYASYTGKYIFKFAEVSDAKSYLVYIDNEETPVATLTGSGDYITNEELSAYPYGVHTFYLVSEYDEADNSAKSEGITVTTAATGSCNDIAQIYIQTDDTSVNALSINKPAGKYKSSITVVDEKGIYDDVVEDVSKTTIKVRGNSTAGADKKAFNITFGSSKDLFGLGAAFDGSGKGEKKWSLLANAFDKALIRNKLANDLGTIMELPFVSQSKFVDLYLNGRYMGSYLLIESIEVGKDRVNISAKDPETDDVLIELENNGKDEEGVDYIYSTRYNQKFNIGCPEHGDMFDEDSPEDVAALAKKETAAVSFIDEFETALENNDTSEIEKLIDMDSFAKFYVVSEIFKNQDIAFSSTRFYITTDKDGNKKLFAGPLWDFDLSSGNIDPAYYGAEDQSYKYYQAKDMIWFNKLMSNTAFKRKAIKEFYNYLPQIEALYTGDGNEIAALMDTCGDSFRRNYTAVSNGGAGWSETVKDSADGYSYANVGYTSFDQSITFLGTWLENRVTWLKSQWPEIIEEVTVAPSDKTTAEKIADPAYNIALGKNVTISSDYANQGTHTGATIVDGIYNNNEYVSTDWDASLSSDYVIIDLGDYYQPSALESVASMFISANTAPTDYSIEFSKDGVNYQKVYTGVGVTYETIMNAPLNTSVYKNNAVRYVKVYMYGHLNWGFQIREMAIIVKEGADLTPVEVSTVEEATGLIVSSDNYNEISVTFNPGEGQAEAGYTYYIYVDDRVVKESVSAGTYTLTGIKAGVHTVKVRAYYDSMVSTGISDSVTVSDAPVETTTPGPVIEDLGTYTSSIDKTGSILNAAKTIDGVSFNNYIKYTGITSNASSGTSSLVHDGIAGDNSRWESAQKIDPQYIIVDLGAVYSVKEIQALWEAAQAKDFTVEISTDGIDYQRAATVTGAISGDYRLDVVTLKNAADARYIKINGTARNMDYGYSIWEVAVYGPDAQKEEPTQPPLPEEKTNANLTAACGAGTTYITGGTLYYGEFLFNTDNMNITMGAQGKSAEVTLNGEILASNSGNTAIGLNIAYSKLAAGRNTILVKQVLSDGDGATENIYTVYIDVPLKPMNVTIGNYGSNTGKYLFKFDAVTDAVNYSVYIDDVATPVATIANSGGYLTNDQLSSYAYGSHVFYLTANLSDGTETGKSSGVTITTAYAVSDNDIAQMYIQTDDTSIRALDIIKDQGKLSSSITVIDQNGQYDDVIEDVDGKTTIKVRGNSTAVADKKAFNITFNKKKDLLGLGSAYDGAGEGNKKWSLLANAFDKSLIRNKLAMDLGTALEIPYVSQSRFVDLYINGRFMGNYLLIESVEVGPDRVNIDSETPGNTEILLEIENSMRVEEGVDYITTTNYNQRFNVGSPEHGDMFDEDSEEDKAALAEKEAAALEYLNNFETALAANDYEAIDSYIDIDSFVDFYIVSEIFKTQDINFSSTRFYITKNGTDNYQLYAGPLWDLDLSSGNVSPGYYGNEATGYTGYQAQAMTWFEKLMQNDTFKKKVVTRFYEKLPVIQAMYMGDNNEIDTLINDFSSSFTRNYTTLNNGGAGWSATQKDSADGYSYANIGWASFDESVSYLRTWLANRVGWLESEWPKSIIEEPTEEPTKPITSTSVKVEGYQISASFRGVDGAMGFRTVYSVEPTIEDKAVTEKGLIYGIVYGENPISKTDLVLGSTNEYIVQYAATEAGKLNNIIGDSPTASYYARTMEANNFTAEGYNATYYTRAYAILEDGTTVYSDVTEMTIYKVASKVYDGTLMSNHTAHNHVYNNILKVVNPQYQEIEYGWNNTLVQQ